MPTDPVIPVVSGLNAVHKNNGLNVSFESNFDGEYAHAVLKDNEIVPQD